MFVFEKEQVIHSIGSIRIGGSPGEVPTALAGTIFYGGHKIVSDPQKGIFDKKAAEVLIRKQDEMSDLTGNPSLVQIFSESAGAMRGYIDYVSDLTSAPFLIDSTDASVRLEGLRHAEEIGLLDCAVYNSINMSITPEEREGLMEIGPESAIVLAYNPQDPSIAGKRAVLEKGVLTLEKGLLELSKELGVTKPLVDTAITAMGAGAGSAVAFTFVSKTLYGLPTGCGIHNAPSSWPWLRKLKKQDRDAFKTADIASNLVVQALGADFLLYGPIENASRVFPSVAMTDVFSAESAEREFGLEATDNHPYRRLL